MNFLELCQQRSSVRTYSSKPIEQEKLDYIMECVRLAPSAVNFQPWKFYLIKEQADCERIRTIYAREWFATAPMYIVACRNTSEEWVRKYDNKPHGDIDISIAVEHLCLAATEQGLGTCWVCHFDPQKFMAQFPLPEHLEPTVIIPIGYNEKELDVKDKKRKDASDIIEIWK